MDDKQRIIDLGGPTRVAELLEFQKHNGAQRVHNWMKRGIPARIKLARPDLFKDATGCQDHKEAA